MLVAIVRFLYSFVLSLLTPVVCTDCTGVHLCARLGYDCNRPVLLPRIVQVAKSELRQKLLMCSPGLLWLVIMFVKPHKVTRPLHALVAVEWEKLRYDGGFSERWRKDVPCIWTPSGVCATIIGNPQGCNSRSINLCMLIPDWLVPLNTTLPL